MTRAAETLRLQKANRSLSLELQTARADQRTLEQARAHYADLFDFAPVTYALLDSVGVVLKVNLAACRLLNVERSHLVGHPLINFAVREDRRELLEHFRRCRTSKDVVESEVRLLSVGNPVATCRLYSKCATYDDREAFPTVIVDQTEHLALDHARLSAERRRDQAERVSEQAQSASAAKDRFLADVSHELRTPLTPALFAASHLASWQALPDEARKLAATIKRNIEFEARLIDDLLDVARINRDRISLELITLDVHDVLQEAIDICRAFAEVKEVDITTHLTAAAHHVRGDRARLRQVFWNVLNNAIKYTQPRGAILVRTANVSAATLRVSIRDKGAGMDTEVLEHLFAPFDRRPIDHESRMGLGLGLTICKGIVSAHGGQIWATSDGPGHGSTFAVELATVPEPSRPKGTADSGVRAAEPCPNPPCSVLLIEDDADSSEMLSLFLSQHGYEVGVASSLGEAIRKLDDPWDVVLSDIGLPDGSGLDVARHARLARRPPQRIIALTGYGSNKDIKASQDAGFDDHVVKPIDLDHLLHALSATAATQKEYRHLPDVQPT